MSAYKKALRVEMMEEVREVITSDKTFDHASGGSRREQKISRTILSFPVVVLECGHHRKQRPAMKTITNAKRLVCFECERLAASQQQGKQEDDNGTQRR